MPQNYPCAVQARPSKSVKVVIKARSELKDREEFSRAAPALNALKMGFYAKNLRFMLSAHKIRTLPDHQQLLQLQPLSGQITVVIYLAVSTMFIQLLLPKDQSFVSLHSIYHETIFLLLCLTTTPQPLKMVRSTFYKRASPNTCVKYLPAGVRREFLECFLHISHPAKANRLETPVDRSFAKHILCITCQIIRLNHIVE